MEFVPMLPSELPGPSDVQFGGQVVSLDNDAFDELFPKTSIDHLLSEEERQKAKRERWEFEAVGRTLFMNEASLYLFFYELVCERIASGVSPDVIQGEMSNLHQTSGHIRCSLSGRA